MTRIFVVCLVAFPLIFVGMLLATGTLQDYIVPQLSSLIDEKLGRGEEEEVDPGFDVIDSLIVADVESREHLVEARMDSLEVIQSRIESERKELAQMSTQVQSLVNQLMALEQSLDVSRQKEKRAMAKLIGGMEPEAAAELLVALDPESQEFLIKSMPTRAAAEILGLMPRAIAAPLIAAILNPTDGTSEGETQ